MERNCYIIQRDDGTFYRTGEWVKEPPFEVFIWVADPATVENIAKSLGGTLIELGQVLGKEDYANREYGTVKPRE